MPAIPRAGPRSPRRTSPPGSTGCRGAVGAEATPRSVPRRNTRITCSSSGRAARLTNSGGSPASTPKGFTSAMRVYRQCTCRAGTTPMPAPQGARLPLQPHQSLATEQPGGGAAPLTCAPDPYNPVPTIGGAMSSGEPVMRAGAYDQRITPGLFGARPPYGPLSDRPDVLSFATPPLAGDLEVAGQLEFHLVVASVGPGADCPAQLIEIYPPSTDYPQGVLMKLTE